MRSSKCRVLARQHGLDRARRSHPRAFVNGPQTPGASWITPNNHFSFCYVIHNRIPPPQSVQLRYRHKLSERVSAARPREAGSCLRGPDPDQADAGGFTLTAAI